MYQTIVPTKQLGSGIFIGQLLIIFNDLRDWYCLIRDSIIVGIKLELLYIISGMGLSLHLCLPNLVQNYGNTILLFIFARWEKWWHIFFIIWWYGIQCLCADIVIFKILLGINICYINLELIEN